MAEELKPGLALLRADFPPHQISKLPKGTKAQNECDASIKKNCAICGGWHHPQIKHLDYVGHAALTDRLLDADPAWSWEPVAFNAEGLPAFDKTGGLWIRLTVCGVTRLGYGNAASKPSADPGAREKEVIGDALRNAAMRFGAALDLWHKGKLHADDDTEDDPPPPAKPVPFVLAEWIAALGTCHQPDALIDVKSRGLAAATEAKDETGYRAIRTEANKLAKLAGWAEA